MKYEKEALKAISSSCLLCYDPKCDRACPKGYKPSDLLRSLKFDNFEGAGKHVDKDVCKDCPGYCEKACIHFDRPVEIKKAIELSEKYDKSQTEPSLEIDFMGIKCENPFFLSSSVVASTYDMCARALEAGWGGIVYKTIGFYIPEEVSPRFSSIEKDGTPFVGFKNLEQISEHTPEENFAILAELKKNYPNKIIVASIMGQTEDEWTKLASLAEKAGCDIIECNFSCPQMAAEKMGSAVGADPEMVKLFTAATRKGTKLPILAKMTPNVTDMVPPAMAAMEGGATGIAAINTIKCLTNVNLDTMEGDPNVNGKTSVSGYSGKAVKPISLRFIYEMASDKGLKGVPLSGIGGIETWKDVLEFLALGCSNVQVTTAVMQYGYRIIDDLIDGTKNYMRKSNIKSLNDIVSKGVDNVVSPMALDRNTRVFPVFDRSKCINCKRCYISCLDGGHQAIEIKDDRIVLNPKKCVGCLLCKLVCPTNSISSSKRFNK